MKRIATIILLGFAVATSCFAAKVEEVHLVVGALNVIELPFPVLNCRVADNSLVTVEMLDANRKIRLSGVKLGTTELQAVGESETLLYRITVVSNLQEIVRTLTNDLENIPEVDVSISGNKVTLKGEISSIVHWEMLQRLLPFYNRSVVNLVTFQPKAEVMMLLQNALTKAGYKVVKEGTELTHGDLVITPIGDSLNISGSVYSPEDLKRIEEILNTQSWLSTKKGDKKIRAIMNVQVVPEMLEIGAVYVGMDKSQAEAIGNNFLENGISLSFNAGYSGTIDRNFDFHRGGGSYSIGTGLSTVIRLLGENTNSVFRQAGFLTFKSNDTPAYRTLHNGGTLKVRVSGLQSGSIEDVDYGFKLKIKGGLTGKDKVYMDINVTVSAPVVLENGDYDVKTKTVETSVVCKLDETIALGGIQELFDDATGPNGVPYLRHIPIINWFVAEQSQNYTDKQTLLLISPRLMSQAKPLEIPPAQELRDVEEGATISIREGQRDQRRWYEFWRW